jgi:hypothetical protein
MGTPKRVESEIRNGNPEKGQAKWELGKGNSQPLTLTEGVNLRTLNRMEMKEIFE